MQIPMTNDQKNHWICSVGHWSLGIDWSFWSGHSGFPPSTGCAVPGTSATSSGKPMARSVIPGFVRAGVEVSLVAPRTLLPPDADAFKGQEGKFEKFFSPNPGKR